MITYVIISDTPPLLGGVSKEFQGGVALTFSTNLNKFWGCTIVTLSPGFNKILFYKFFRSWGCMVER